MVVLLCCLAVAFLPRTLIIRSAEWNCLFSQTQRSQISLFAADGQLLQDFLIQFGEQLVEILIVHPVTILTLRSYPRPSPYQKKPITQSHFAIEKLGEVGRKVDDILHAAFVLHFQFLLRTAHHLRKILLLQSSLIQRSFAAVLPKSLVLFSTQDRRHFSTQLFSQGRHSAVKSCVLVVNLPPSGRANQPILPEAPFRSSHFALRWLISQRHRTGWFQHPHSLPPSWVDCS